MRTDIPLQFPIKIEGAEVKVLRVRRPKVGDLRAVRSQAKGMDDFEVSRLLAANLCEISPEAIDQLDVADYKALEDLVEGWLNPSKE